MHYWCFSLRHSSTLGGRVYNNKVSFHVLANRQITSQNTIRTIPAILKADSPFNNTTFTICKNSAHTSKVLFHKSHFCSSYASWRYFSMRQRWSHNIPYHDHKTHALLYSRVAFANEQTMGWTSTLKGGLGHVLCAVRLFLHETIDKRTHVRKD